MLNIVQVYLCYAHIVRNFKRVIKKKFSGISDSESDQKIVLKLLIQLANINESYNDVINLWKNFCNLLIDRNAQNVDSYLSYFYSSTIDKEIRDSIAVEIDENDVSSMLCDSNLEDESLVFTQQVNFIKILSLILH